MMKSPKRLDTYHKIKFSHGKFVGESVGMSWHYFVLQLYKNPKHFGM